MVNLGDFHKEDIVSIYCVRCGEELTEQTGVLASPDWYGDTRFVHYCRKCQQEQFLDFASSVSPYMAFFLCCAAYNIPFIPECVPDMGKIFDSFSWIIYLDNIKTAEKNLTLNGEPASFSDGVTDVQALFGITQKTKINSEITSAMLDQDKAGSKRQRQVWGEFDKYTDADYKELDRLYSVQSKAYEAGGISEELEFNLREICKLQLVYSKQRAAGETKEMRDTYGVISKMKADNLLRKKDEAPPGEIKIDSLIAALERNGYARKGKLVSYKELLDILREYHPVYSNGRDIVDQILLSVWNAYRRNEGLSETNILPVEMQITPKKEEFSEQTTDAEKELIASLNLPPIQYEKAKPAAE